MSASPPPAYGEKKRLRLLWSGLLSAVGFLLLILGVRTSTIAVIVLGVMGAFSGLAIGYPLLRNGIKGLS